MPEQAFDLCGELPEPGVTLLEASAGTGKTYALAGLVTRFVAEGVASMADILAVSFTRAAAGELKERVRSRLVATEAGLARYLQRGEGPEPADALLALLAHPGPLGTAGSEGHHGPGMAPASAGLVKSPANRAVGSTFCAGPPCHGDGSDDGISLVQQRRRRLLEALANFDAATITTTHGFCYMVLSSLGVWGEFSPGTALLEDPRELVEEVVDDLYARWVSRRGELPFPPKVALQIGNEAVKNWAAAVEPPAEDHDLSKTGLRRRLANGVRNEVARRLAKANLVTYDSILARLADALNDSQRGHAARRRLAERYRVVLIDEFQDTDLVQWEVVHKAFARSGVRLVLIGDPKQAIFAFRGADVYAYLSAKRHTAPASRFTLERNWRCDGRLGEALDALFYPLQLGHPEISYRPMKGYCQQEGTASTPYAQPLRLRWLARSQPYPGQSSRADRSFQKAEAERLVAVDVARDVTRLLAKAAAAPAQGPCTAPIEPSDIAVLVRTNEQANLVQDELLAAGAPAVVATSRSVMSTPAAQDWLCLLDAVQQPASRSLAAKAALGDFFGRRPEELAAGDERFWEAVHARLREWGELLQSAGVAALFAEACASEELPKRLLSEVQGERRLTDLAHIAELLHAEAKRSQLGPAALRAWLAQRSEETTTERPETEELCRRLDSGSQAVQVLTVHRAKGLEFPVVYCPYLWATGKTLARGAPICFHDDQSSSRRFDPGGQDATSYGAHFELAKQEIAGEDLRQMYVAATRAKHHLVLWWAPAPNCQRSPLGRLLLAPRGSDGALASPSSKEPADADVEAALRRVAARAPGLVGIERIDASPAATWQTRPVAPTRPLGVMAFERSIDTAWGRLSYSSIAARAHGEPPVGSEPDEPGIADEPPAGDESAAATMLPASGAGEASEEMALRSKVSPWAGIGTGTTMGTFVHKVLQLVDFSAPDLTVALGSALDALEAGYPGPAEGRLNLVDALQAAITTPLGAVAEGASLRDISRADRLDELTFELPLAGGERPCGEATIADIADVLALYVPRGDPLSSYADFLRASASAGTLRGYLNGSLDLVFRLSCEGRPRYFVVDYKTNWLAPRGEVLSAWHYRPSALTKEMARAHYVLQALFYLVALHRYLRWRLSGYDPAEHLGGVLYLFVRGMFGPEQPSTSGHPCGVFSWLPPAGLVPSLSGLLAGRKPPL